jgi:GNAT superfamily N-acetyltransferase
MLIRRIQVNEGAIIRQLRLAALADAPAAFGGSYAQAEMQTEDEYAEIAFLRATSNSDAIFIAQMPSGFGGMIGAFFDNKTRKPFISSMWVTPELRRGGLGAQLYQAASKWLRVRGAVEINAWVATDNYSAIEFYESLGFVAKDTFAPLPSDLERTEQLYVQYLSTS